MQDNFQYFLSFLIKQDMEEICAHAVKKLNYCKEELLDAFGLWLTKFFRTSFKRPKWFSMEKWRI